MLIFPPLSTGASAQYPVKRARSERTIINITPDGRAITLPDYYGKQIRWSLRLDGLTDQEANNYLSFFELCEGPLQPFLFLDPTANLVLFSEDLTQSAWQINSLLTGTGGVGDPFGTTRASRLVNTSGASLSATQTIPIPGSAWAAFSVYLRASQGEGFQMTRTDGSSVSSLTPSVGGSWNRFTLSSVFASSVSTNCDFSLSVPAGATLDVFGFQVDAQPSAGIYVQNTGESGVYPNARFDLDQLTVTATGLGQSSMELSILSEASR
jgi:hypothetical protein